MEEKRRYGKSIADVLHVKKSFFHENEKLLQESQKVSALYRSQAKRVYCKVCEQRMPEDRYFECHETDYYLCLNCGHINGGFDDGTEFANELYASELYGGQYKEASATEFLARMDSIYVPKVKFMTDSLECASQFSFLDVGAGSGYMTSAMDRIGLDVSGIEVSRMQVDYGNTMIGKPLLRTVSIDEINSEISNTEKDVLVFMGVLEHVTNLTEILESISKNSRVKYIYFSVPMLSLSCIFEIIFTDVFARVIGGGGGHTHLFTEESIKWIFDKYSFKWVSSWRFGGDILDLYRSIVVTLEKKNCHSDLIKKVTTLFHEEADAMQLLVDKAGFASEIHILAKVH